MPDIEILTKVAKELNSVMGLNPPINTRSFQDLGLQIRRNALGEDEQGNVDSDETLSAEQDGGKFSREVEDFLDEHGLLPDGWELLPEKENAASSELEPEPEPETVEEKEPNETKIEEKKVSKKKKGKKAKAKVSKKIREKKKTVDKPIAKETIKKLTKSKFVYTRSHALVDALKKGGNRKDIIELSNQLYVKKGGLDKVNIATNCFSLSLPVLVLLGTVKKENDKYTLAK